LDRMFVTHLRSDADNIAIVNALLDLARNFELQVVAEGVEDQETWIMLAALGCDVVQGYYLSKPIPTAEFATWLAQRVDTPASPRSAVPSPPWRVPCPLSVRNGTSLDRSPAHAAGSV